MLSFTVNTTLVGGTAPTYGCHGYNWIQSLTLWSSAGSSQLEQITNYNALHAALRDLCSSQDMVRTRDSILLGSDPTRLRSPVQNAAAVTSVQYSVPLISIIGLLSNTDRMLPIHALGSALRLDVEIAQASTAIASGGTVAATSATCSLSNVTLDCSYITLVDSAADQIKSLTGNRYDWSSSQWKCYRTIHSAGALSNSVMIPSRVSSMKSLIIIQREAATEYNIAASSVTQRIRNQLKQFAVRVGGSWVTTVPIQCGAQALPAYLEATRIFSNPASESTCGLIASDSWTLDTSVAPTTTSVEGSFMIASELDVFSQQKLVSGHSTSANALVCEIVYSAAPLGVNIDSFCEADAQFHIDGATGSIMVAV
ncbi:hypothetical protein JKP88DRAFT_254500 [Tribonema minus]|uniref:Uncharacterized protein n=1 Tax=Tribonema minus TaxID=303371 RepID=A0A836CKA3_9STRA|nr:hypothetical protein JKP88DRAFT_254500 [Tribonema minus]